MAVSKIICGMVFIVGLALSQTMLTILEEGCCSGTISWPRIWQGREGKMVIVTGIVSVLLMSGAWLALP